MLGWFIGLGLVNWMFNKRLVIPAISGEIRTFLIVVAGVALMIGLLFRSYEMMAGRLRQREWAERELEIARSIQTRLLPPEHIEGDGFSVAARNLPAHYVAGDFYDIVRLDDGSVMIAVADVAGHGIGAGLTMASVKAVLPFLAPKGLAETMQSLNQRLARELGPREFVAFVCAVYQPQTGVLEIANAGCPDPYLLTRNGVETISCDGVRLPLGLRPELHYSTTTRRLDPGGRLLLLSDGIPEASRLEGQPLGYDALQQIVDALRNLPDRGTAWLDRLLREVQDRVGTNLTDDWTALLLER
jgi:sigma-B regulation protein RsbU (phosphoserine phosphatase)